jgi:tRNA(Ile)-lysidine synthase
VNLLERLEQQIVTRKLFRERQSILLGVSGGVDSMVLLHCLSRMARQYRWQLTVAHFNHRLRGRSSDADERLVRTAAVDYGLQVVVSSADVKKFAKQQKLSIEMAGRRLRHEFFALEARRCRARVIALAHHADDQAELFLIRLLRGAGGTGLGGMQQISRSPVNASVKVIRPLLEFTKVELSDYAKDERIRYREDASNAQLDFVRNRIRHEVLPQLSRIQPGAVQTILRSMEIIRAESDYVLADARAWMTALRKSPFEELPVAVQRRCLELQLRDHSIVPDFNLVENLRINPNQPFAFAADRVVQRDFRGTVTISRRFEPFLDDSWPVDLAESPNFGMEGWQLTWKLESRAGTGRRPQGAIESFDAEKVGQRILLRHWRPGDRFQPIGMSHAVKLQDLFVNEKIPQEIRHRLIVAENQNGIIFWVEGLRIGEVCKLISTTQRRLTWAFRRTSFGHCG